MTKNISRSIYGKNTLTFLFALAALAFIVLGCGGSKGNFKAVPAAFHGSWTGADGTTLNISNDGTVVYRSGATKIDNGAAELDETAKVLKLSLFGVSLKEYKIDEMPSGGKMKLDGVVYQTGGKGEVDDTPTPKTGPVDKDMPSDSDRDALVSSTMEDFKEAVEKGDFADFRDNCSDEFKKTVTTEKFNQTFDQFIKQKEDLVPILNSTAGMTPDYSPDPEITTQSGRKLLNLKGTFDTAQKTTFDMQYILDKGGDWKLFMIRVRVDPA